MFSRTIAKFAAAGAITLALVLVPAPLLPPHWAAEAVESVLGLSWKAAYLVAAIGLQGLFYGAPGVVAALTLSRAQNWRASGNFARPVRTLGRRR